jgi:sec-independent protein translocase protein TatA
MRLTEILVVILVIVIVFGASRIPSLGKSIGEGFKELKRGLREADEEEKQAREKDQAVPGKKRKRAPAAKRKVKTRSQE